MRCRPRFHSHFVLLVVALFASVSIQAQTLQAFAEYGATVAGGDNVPLWQVSNVHGFSSLKNNTYIRTGAFYDKELRNDWKLNLGLDIGVATGFTSTFVVQQAFAEVGYMWLGMFVGSREKESPLLNQQLSSGGLTWSGNARPIPQVSVGIFDYVALWPSVWLKGEISYGQLTDNGYQREQVGEGHWYTKDIKYHHKSFFFRFGKPTSRWNFYVGASMDCFFGGYNVGGGMFAGDLGNSLKDYWLALVPIQGKGTNSQNYYQGNYLGSEHLKATYRHKDFTLSAYLENFYDDFTGIGKLNGLDGLWGLELKLPTAKVVNNVVLEYYQTTNQSGPLHGPDDSVVPKTDGADDYYNNHWYPAWAHWGMTMANPLVASPIYNKDGDLTVKYNRVKAIHLAWSGIVANGLTYRAKLSYNQTWGTPFRPTTYILENFSSFFELQYSPMRLPQWCLKASLAFDTGDIYGDNLGVQIKIRRFL